MRKLDMGICLSIYGRVYCVVVQPFSPMCVHTYYVVLLQYADGGGMLEWGRGEESGPCHQISRCNLSPSHLPAHIHTPEN